MFKECTSLISALALPVITLVDSCYSRMFYGCASLITIPALPAKTLADSCYNLMFSDCKSLKFSRNKDIENGCVNEFKLGNNSMNKSLFNIFNGTGGSFKGIPSGGQVLYTSNEIVK